MSELELISEMEENGQWVTSHYDEIREKYTNKFIAVKDKQIIEKNASFNKLLEALRSKGQDLDRLLIDFVHGEEFAFIL